MKLKEIRMAKGISQLQAAKDLNLAPNVYGRYENGQREPSFIVLLAIADYFGVSVDELLGRTPQEEEKKQEDEASAIRERLRCDPAYRTLFSAANKATPDHIRAATAVLKALEPEEPDAD